MDGGEEFYWGAAAYTAALMNDAQRLEGYLAAVEKHRRQEPSTLYNADAAFISMACTQMIEGYALQIGKLDPLHLIRGKQR